MTQRFQIEDILAQDHHGVVFSALDTETGRHVALRRFFPFGSDGGGLQPEERAAYDIGVKRLAEVIHPGLRSVVTGGCDPVDGMPFLATQWVEGTTLKKLLEQGSLTVESTIALMNQAMEVSELLSHVLADDEVWVETAPAAIVIGDGESDRGITFWISPFRWLSTEDERPGLLPLVELLESAMGWQGKNVSDHAGGGLGGWLKWLKANGKTATWNEARAALETAIQQPSPVAKTVKVPAKGAARPPLVVSTPKTSVLGRILIALLILTAIGLGGLLWVRNNGWTLPGKEASASGALDGALTQKDGTAGESKAERAEITPSLPDSTPSPAPKNPPATTPPPPADKPAPAKSPPQDEAARVAAANARAAELSGNNAKEAELRAKRMKEIAAKNGVFDVNDFELVAAQMNKELKVEGLLVRVDQSNSGKTGYLRFSTDKDASLVEAKFDKPTKDPGLQDSELTKLIGKRIRFTGNVDVSKLNGIRRVQVEIPNRAAIELVP